MVAVGGVVLCPGVDGRAVGFPVDLVVVVAGDVGATVEAEGENMKWTIS